VIERTNPPSLVVHAAQRHGLGNDNLSVDLAVCTPTAGQLDIMADWMRKQLEELMGQEALGYAPSVSSIDDPKACRDYLCGLCPYELFVNTKSDVGTCPKQASHSDSLRTEYERAVKSGSHAGFEADHLRSLERFVEDCDRKVSIAARKLEKIQQEDPKASELMKAINDITDAMATLMTDLVQLGTLMYSSVVD